MFIDCNTCTARGLDCQNCVVTHFLALPTSGGLELNAPEERALGVLRDAGLVPPLQMQSQEALTRRRTALG